MVIFFNPWAKFEESYGDEFFDVDNERMLKRAFFN